MIRCWNVYTSLTERRLVPGKVYHVVGPNSHGEALTALLELQRLGIAFPQESALSIPDVTCVFETESIESE